MEIDVLRDRINSIDAQILKLLSERRSVARDVIDLKKSQGMLLRDARREEDLLAQRIDEGRSHGLDAHFVTRVFHEILDDSVRAQELVLQQGLNREEARLLRVAYQGIEGAYSQLAAKRFFASNAGDVSYYGYPTFAEVVDVVEENIADYGLLPVENTTAGNINEVYDLLSRTKLQVVGEVIFQVDHCLLACEEVPISLIRRVLSHPQALAQCTRFLSQLRECRQEFYVDTAMAVRKVKEDGDPTQAAIASEEAGKLYGLKVIQRKLADQPENYTRFIVAARKPIRVDYRIPCKTSIIMATAHQPGALNKALDAFYRQGINLTKLDARPKPGSPFEYLFYIDFEGNLEEDRVQKTLAGLRGSTTFLKILGCYPMESRQKTPPSAQAIAHQRPRSSPRAVGEEEPPAAAVSALRSEEKGGDQAEEARLIDRSTKAESTVLRIRGAEIGGAEFVVIAGPCSVESEEQVRLCARQVKECGGKMLRGGCFKPRTSPRSFQGLGFEGLELLVRAGREYDLPVVTEVLSPADVVAVAELADVLLVGARNMQNYGLLGELAKVNRPVILKRGTTASLDEFLDAAEYIFARGNHQVILCERGIRTFETVTRNTLDLGAIPIIKKRSHLPVIVDPSHAAGQRDLVVPLALAAHAVGPHGMMVEIHPEPEKALSDGPLALRFEDFAEMMDEIYQG
ncbi:MAG: bifunctional 3-deoxy-7-phosphoheptulonate synthase/chorismate mutase [Planctomycetes bacterium]|nr:bifunctional 3-deoxy-7-phosphoheptulonate synthase/chorismate mutase [Planctomycetota bacterium]